MPDVVDLRSDTVTVPTPQMRRAMADAEVGDDCYGEDPTVNRLQELACEVLGTEAAMLVPTGTMANQVALKVLTRPGDEVVCDADCHLVHHESGACAIVSQVQLATVHGGLGVLEPGAVRAAVRPGDDPFSPRTAAIAIENTHNAGGGVVWQLDAARAIRVLADEHGLPVFCDGARLFNACAATGVPPAGYAAVADVVTISLYKGLAAPMGSLVCGTRETIDSARRARRVLGGAMRQAGVIAAAGIVGLRTMVSRLPEDHANARLLAEGMAAVAADGTVPMERVQSNMVLYRAGGDAGQVAARLAADGVLCGAIAPGVLRFVTHKDVDAAGVRRAVGAFAAAVR